MKTEFFLTHLLACLLGCLILAICTYAYNEAEEQNKPQSFYKAVPLPLVENNTSRIIHTTQIDSVSLDLYEDEETVFVEVESSKICNNHLDTHVSCEKFLIIQSLQ